MSDYEYTKTIDEEINRMRQNVVELEFLIARAENMLEDLTPLDTTRKVWEYGLVQRKTRLAAYRNMLSALKELK